MNCNEFGTVVVDIGARTARGCRGARLGGSARAALRQLSRASVGRTRGDRATRRRCGRRCARWPRRRNWKARSWRRSARGRGVAPTAPALIDRRRHASRWWLGAVAGGGAGVGGALAGRWLADGQPGRRRRGPPSSTSHRRRRRARPARQRRHRRRARRPATADRRRARPARWLSTRGAATTPGGRSSADRRCGASGLREPAGGAAALVGRAARAGAAPVALRGAARAGAADHERAVG